MAYSGLLACLGNPGQKYRNTRHNMGFIFLEQLLATASSRGSVEELNGKKFHGQLWAFTLPNVPGRWLALAPHTFMNESGLAVQPTLAWHNLTPDQLLVVQDEMDIPTGALRFRFGGGLAGHNGLASIAAHLGTKDFYRLRIGIGKPAQRDDTLSWVLGRPQTEDWRKVIAVMPLAIEAFILFTTQGAARATEFAHNAQKMVEGEITPQGR